MTKRRLTGDQMAEQIMATSEVAEYFDIAPSAVRGLLRRFAVRELRGYARADIEAIRLLDQDSRTDQRRKYDPPS